VEKATPVQDDKIQKNVLSQLKKVEEKITAIETELSDSAEYEKLVQDKHFFDNYNRLKTELEVEMSKWENLSSNLKA